MGRRMRLYLKIFSAMVIDVVMINASVYLALYLRFDVPYIPYQYMRPYQHIAVYFTLMTLLLLWITRVYHRMWQYAGSRDAQVLIGSILGSAVFLDGFLLLDKAAHYPRGVYLLYVLFALALVGGWRFLIRSYYDITWMPKSKAAPRVLIVGAGKAGQMVAQELGRHPEVGLAVGFLDDDVAKRGMQIGNLKVLGSTEDLPQRVRDRRVDQVLFAIPSASGKILRPLVERCRDLDVQTRLLPAINQMIGGQVLVNQIRDVQIEDLLQREPANIDLAEIAGYITNRTVMVTGAGGTIGSELCRQVGRFSPKALVVLGIDETSVFDIEQEMRNTFPDMEVVPVVADLRDSERTRQLMEQTRPQVIFHAAAHKHVPLMEVQPPEAIRNNVEGFWGFVELAQKMHVERFVFLSTDKAVNPTSVYGTTKRIGEILGGIYGRNSRMRFVTVRFGNVLGSRGSVLPTFQRQIAKGGPVTVTHPEMVRYFMTVAEACQLVVQAGAMGQGGETLVLDMGEPLKILDLASNLIRLSGLQPGTDIDIVFTGLRPGEKLYEEPLTPEDQTKATKNSRIFIHTGKVPDAKIVLPLLERLVQAGRKADEPEIRRLLKEIVPEYQPLDRAMYVVSKRPPVSRDLLEANEGGNRAH